MKNIAFRELIRKEIGRIREIDRGEEIESSYRYKKGILVLVPTPETVTHFDDRELEQLLAAQERLQQNGGQITGAFHNDRLVGVVSVERKRRGSREQYCKMDILYVSKSCRGMQIGSRLIEESKKAAKAFGAELLYISATPTRNTVDFYLRHGATLTSELDQELFDREPEDIHLEMPLD